MSKEEANVLVSNSQTFNECCEKLGCNDPRILKALIKQYNLDTSHFEKSPKHRLTEESWGNYLKEELQEIVKNSLSFSDVARECGLSRGSYNSIAAVKKMIEYYNFDISHFDNKGQKKVYDYSLFKNGVYRKSGRMLPALIALRGRTCECCGLSIWNDQPIPLEIHHEDGNRLNNELSNLKILCRNCHALTNNWWGKNKSKLRQFDECSEEEVFKAITQHVNAHQALKYLNLSTNAFNYSKVYDFKAKKQFMFLE